MDLNSEILDLKRCLEKAELALQFYQDPQSWVTVSRPDQGSKVSTLDNKQGPSIYTSGGEVIPIYMGGYRASDYFEWKKTFLSTK